MSETAFKLITLTRMKNEIFINFSISPITKYVKFFEKANKVDEKGFIFFNFFIFNTSDLFQETLQKL